MAELKLKFGKRLKELRKNKNFTQEDFAEMINISPRNLSKIETGKTFPSVENLEKIALKLKCKVMDLFDFEHLKSPSNITFDVIETIKSLPEDKLVLFYKIISALK